MSRSGVVLFATLLAVTLPLAAWLAAPIAAEAPTAPQEPTAGNAAAFTALAVAFVALATGMAFLLLYLVRTGRTRWLRAFFLGAVAIVLTLAWARPALWLTPWTGGTTAWLLGLAASVALVVMWARSTAPWLQATMAVLVSACIAALLGSLLGVTALLFLLVGVALYDLWAVRRSGHMQRLADAAQGLRLPLMVEHGRPRVQQRVAFRPLPGPAPQEPPTDGPGALGRSDGHGHLDSQDPSGVPDRPEVAATSLAHADHPAKTGAPDARPATPAPSASRPRRRPRRRGGGSMLMGMGDLAFPAAWFVAVVGAANTNGWGPWPAVGAWVGTLAGYAALVVLLKRRPVQPGIPPLAGGAIAGAAIGLWLATGSLRFW